VTITLEWEGFAAYLNPTAGGGTINSNSGGFRAEKGVVLLKEKICTLKNATHEPPTATPGHWVTRTSITGASAKEPFAEFQGKFVWQDSCGRLQRTSAERSAEYRKCFRSKFVEFMGCVHLAWLYFGSILHIPPRVLSEQFLCARLLRSRASHIDYMSFCMLDEILHLKGLSKASRGKNMIDSKLIGEANGKKAIFGRNGDLFRGAHAKNKSEYAHVMKCGSRPQDCIAAIEGTLKNLECYYETDQDGSGEAVSLRACKFKTATLGGSTAALHLLLLNLPPDVTWTEDKVFVMMTGHWDAAAQRDPRDYVLGEFAEFVSVIEKLRADPRTRRARVLFAEGPSVAPMFRSTGWRNNHAMAAVSAYVAEFLASRPNLRVEVVSPSFMHVTLARQGESADGLHFLLEGGVGERRISNDGSGDFVGCKGAVGEAFTRLLLDQICAGPPARKKPEPRP
jgi:hypothetical protein